MKKRGIIFLFICLMLSASFVFSQGEIVDSVPGGEIISGTIDEDGNIKGVEDVRRGIDQIRSEQDRDYIKQYWTNKALENRFISSSLSYSGGFFSFFDPLWKIIFGFEFSWSWAFFIGLALWIVLAIFTYYPASAFLNSRVFGLVAGFAVSTLTGVSGSIVKAINFLSPFIGNIWIIIILFIILILFVFLYVQFMNYTFEEGEKFKVERNKRASNRLEKMRARSLKDLSDEDK